MRITHFGTATTLLEIEGLRFLTDPTFDEPGKTYGFGFGTRSTKVDVVRMPAGGLGKLDAVLLSHDHHADNLDDAGRALLPGAGKVVTTVSGARRLGGNALGLDPWQTTTVGNVKVTATPARHGPPLSGPIVGDVIGFVLEWPGQQHGPLYISGDTVRFAGVDEVARRFRIGTALLHIGGVAFPISGPLRYTFSGEEAADVAELLGAKTVIPIHYEGWTHFREQRDRTAQALSRLGDRVRWLTPGEPTEVDV